MADTTKRFNRSLLQPGDCLLYRPASFFGWLIAVKTWNKISHVEVFSHRLGNVDWSYASRDGIGVNRYSFRTAQLSRVLRPNGLLNLNSAEGWFKIEARGQKYDWLGLLCFTLAVKQGSPNKMFCSEFATRWYRAAGFHPFADGYDADKIAPANFLVSPNFTEIWSVEAKPQ